MVQLETRDKMVDPIGHECQHCFLLDNDGTILFLARKYDNDWHEDNNKCSGGNLLVLRFCKTSSAPSRPFCGSKQQTCII